MKNIIFLLLTVFLINIISAHVYYNQCDKSWGDNIFLAGKTICEGGSEIVAYAMALTDLGI